MREAKFNFTSEDHISKAPRNGGVEYRVTLIVTKSKDKKTGEDKVQHQLYFSKDVIWLQDLKGKRLKFYVDADKKAIAWRIMGETAVSLDAMNKAREVNPWGAGSWMTGVSKLLNHAGIKIEETRKSIPVETYQTTEMLEAKKYWYIRL